MKLDSRSRISSINSPFHFLSKHTLSHKIFICRFRKLDIILMIFMHQIITYVCFFHSFDLFLISNFVAGFIKLGRRLWLLTNSFYDFDRRTRYRISLVRDFLWLCIYFILYILPSISFILTLLRLMLSKPGLSRLKCIFHLWSSWSFRISYRIFKLWLVWVEKGGCLFESILKSRIIKIVLVFVLIHYFKLYI